MRRFRKVVFFTLIFISIVVLLVWFGSQIGQKFFGIASNGGIKITSIPAAAVYLNDVQVGQTPYQDEQLNPGEYKLRIASGNAQWQGQVKIIRGTLTVVNRELSDNVASSSGEVLTLTSGKGAVLISNPSGSEVEVDGKVMGRTPLSLSDLPPGDHTFILNHGGYLKRSIKAFSPPDLTLTITVDLAITEPNLSTISTPPVQTNPQLVVKSTPTGFLRVREKPTISSNEVTRVNTGDTVFLIEETNGWMKVRLSDGKEGYVASDYVEKKP